ncbi:hypothetical protein N7497_001870 [Penicillium chrysogenum]|uniref:Uncharacterized protein n=1 Tax=Penicillium chrysogenum TaxID=5076 RepID=A0ABQ8WW86_PENCH|nr:hypothetical protein N7505_000946 [Penicillium chrysogenum]KAJ6169027.1 hypothetical protein N7497_001870 [Penicillium chrysogenum]
MSDYTLSANSFCHVTLKDPSNWELWLLIIKTIAEQFEVWDLCDPELDTEPALPKEPIEPSWEDLKRDHPMDWYHIWRVIYTQYKRKLSAYKKKRQGRSVVANAIRQSVHEEHQVFLVQETPWGLLRYLRQWFSPDCDPTYKASLRAAWRNFDQGLDKDTDIDEWLLNWQTLQKRCVKVGITNDSEASAQFLLAISVMSPEFYTVWIKLAETSSAKPIGLLPTVSLRSKEACQKLCFRPGKATNKLNLEAPQLANQLVNPLRKRAWDRAMKADPEWKAFVEKKRADENCSLACSKIC